MLAGFYSMEVTCKAKGISGSPMDVRVKANKVCSARCRANGMGLIKAVKDTDSAFTIVGYDSYDNECENG